VNNVKRKKEKKKKRKKEKKKKRKKRLLGDFKRKATAMKIISKGISAGRCLKVGFKNRQFFRNVRFSSYYSILLIK
jgi:hypothetical protein